MPSDQELLDRILNILRSKPKGMTITEISHVTNIHRNSIAKYLQVLLASGKADVELIGNAKVYTNSRRLPISSMLHCSPDLILLLNKDRKIIQVNDKYLKYFDLDENNVLNKEATDRSIPVISQEDLLPLIEKSLESGERSCKELLFTHQDKSCYFLIQYVPSILENGGHGLIIIIKDFTEEKRIRDALTENEEKFTHLFHNANDSIFLYDITDDRRIGKLIEVNDTACKKLQYTRKEFFQKDFCEIFLSEFHGPACTIESGLAENYHSIYGGIQTKKDGTVFPVEASAHVFSLHDKLVVLYIIRDISERKNAENNLVLSENRYRDIVEMQQELICRISPNYLITYPNDAFRKHFAIQKDPLFVNSLESLAIHHDDLGVIQKCMDLIVTEKQSKSVGFRIHGVDRRTRWIESSISPILDTEGNIHEFQFVGRDITDAVLAKEALKQNEENTRYLLNSTNDDSLLIDLSGRILSLNKSSFEYIRAFSSDDSLDITSIKGKNIFDFIPEELAGIIRDVILEITGSKISDSFVEEMNGRTYNFSLSPIVNSDGEVDKIAVVKRDITERQEYESNLTGTISRLTDIIDFLPEATFVINRDSEVIAWNKAMEHLTGVTKEEIIGQGDHAYSIPFYGEKRPMMIDYVISSDMTQFNPPETIWKEGNSLNAEIWSPYMNDRKGAHIWVKSTGLFDGEGNVIGAIESIQDMTQRKTMERELLQSEEKYRDLVEKTCAIVLKTDIAGTILFVNEFGKNLLGYQKGELINKSVFETLFSKPLENERMFHDIMGKILENPAQFRITENEYTARNGETKWISWTNSPVIDREGHLTGISAVGTDITARKESEIKEKAHIKNLEFISRTAQTFASLPRNEKIYDYISSELISLLPGGVAVVNAYDEKSGTLQIKSIRGEIEGYENMLSTMLNQKVLDKQFTIPEDYRPHLESSKLTHLPGGLYDLFLRNFSEEICITINDVLDIYECYMIGISRENRLFGSISFAIPHRIHHDITSIIEIFVNQASVTLQRCWYENELSKKSSAQEKEEAQSNIDSDASHKNLRTMFETIKNNHILDVRKQNEVFAAVCENNKKCLVLSVDIKGMITRANPKISEILGDGTPIVGKDISAFVARPLRQDAKNIQRFVANNPNDEQVEFSAPLVSESGSAVNVTWNLEKMVDHAGDVTNILWIGNGV